MYEEFTPEYIKRQILEHTDTDISKIEGSFAHDLAAGVAYNMSLLYDELGILYDMIFLKSLFGEYLDEKCAEYGLTRTAGTKAQGYITITARYDMSVPQGTLFSCDGYIFTANAETQIEGGTTTDIDVTAEQIGAEYNITQVREVRPVFSLPGMSECSASAITGGNDTETDEALLSRLKAYIKAAGSGCINDYIKWAKEVAGVGSVEVVPTWNGAGTVKVIITDSEYHGASDELIAKVSEHIEAIRPIGASVTVCAAKAVKIKITADMVRNTNIQMNDITADFKKRAEEYAQEIAKSRGDIRISRLCSLLMQTQGVIDCDNITIITLGEDGTEESTIENLTLPKESIPVISEVVLSEKSI